MGHVDRLVEPALSAALNTLWQAALLAVFVWAILRFIPRMNASTRHAVWWATLATIVLLPGAALVVRSQRFAPARHPIALTVESPDAGPAAPPVSRFAGEERAPVRIRPGDLPALALTVWLALVLVQMTRIAWSYGYLRRLTRRAHPASAEMRSVFDARLTECGIRGRVELLVSGDIASPMAAGFWRPAVILPESLAGSFEESGLDYVLLHELAHIARRDNWTNLAARLAAAFVALHPVALWVLRRIERERELACDDWVVSLTGQAKSYAQCLARLFEVCAVRRRVLLATGMAGPASQLGERIEVLLRRGREFTPKTSFARVTLCAAVVMAFGAAGMLAPRWIAFARDARPAPQQAEASPQMPVKPRAAAPAPRGAAQARPADTLPVPVNGGFLAALVAAGYGDLSVDEIIRLKNAGVGPAYLLGMREAGWGKPAADKLIQLFQSGVSPEYAGRMGEAGLKNLTLEEVVQLRNRGVRAEFVSQIHALGFGPFTAQQAIELASRGVNLAALRALKEAGFADALPGEIIAAQDAGLRESDVREAKRFGARLSLEQIIKLKRSGVLQ